MLGDIRRRTLSNNKTYLRCSCLAGSGLPDAKLPERVVAPGIELPGLGERKAVTVATRGLSDNDRSKAANHPEK